VLRDGSSGPLSPKQLSYAQDIHVAGQHLLDLITDILDLAKIEAGRIDLNMTTVDVVESLEAALQVVRERAKGKGVELRLEADPEVGCIEADARKLRQILFNLLTNAVRFTTPGGPVTIKAARHPDEVEIAVIDTGVGIDPADHERIFQEFEQAGSWEQRKEGTGLGLPLARRMIELHGGSLSLVSSPGRGSTFTVRLPLRPATSNASDSTVPATTGA
jgi:signal transduction histidine kinase